MRFGKYPAPHRIKRHIKDPIVGQTVNLQDKGVYKITSICEDQSESKLFNGKLNCTLIKIHHNPWNMERQFKRANVQNFSNGKYEGTLINGIIEISSLHYRTQIHGNEASQTLICPITMIVDNNEVVFTY